MSNQGNPTDIGAGIATGGLWNVGKGLMSMGGSQNNTPAYPGVIPAFQGDVNQMRQFANSMGGQTAPAGAFSPSPAMMGAANMGNNYFAPGGTGASGMGYLNNVLQGNYLNPSSNPYLQGNINTMQQAFGQTMGSGIDQLNAQFTKMGSGSGESGARNDAMAQFGRGSMQDFSNSLTSFLGQNYQNERGLQNNALGMMNQPMQGAEMASAFGQAPGQMAVEGQQYQNQLAEMPFQMMLQLMQGAPVGYPQYQPYQPGFSDYLMQGLGSAVGNLPRAFAGGGG